MEIQRNRSALRIKKSSERRGSGNGQDSSKRRGGEKLGKVFKARGVM